MRHKLISVMSFTNLILSGLLTVEFILPWIFKSLSHVFTPNSLAERLDITAHMFISIFVVISFIILAIYDHKKAFKWYRILLSITPLVWFLATLNEILMHGPYYLIERIATYKP